MAAELEQDLNICEYVDSYKNAWTVAWDAAQQKFTIKCGLVRAGAGSSGSWICYDGHNGGATVNGADTDIVPYVAAGGGNPEVKRAAFIDLETGFIGNTTQALGSTAGASSGYKVEFTTTDTNYEKYQVSIGIIPDDWATRCRRSIGNTWEGDEYGEGRNADLNFVNETTDTNKDWAFADDGELETTPFVMVGLTVGLDGRVGIIKSQVSNDYENPKGPANRKIEWTATNLGAAGAKKLCICPRYDGANNYPVYQFLADVGAGYVLLGTMEVGGIDGNYDFYRFSNKHHMGILFKEEYLSATSLNLYKVSCLHTGTSAGNPVDPNEPTTLGWKPLGNNNSLQTDIHSRSGLSALMNKCNTRDYFGFKGSQTGPSATAYTVGFVSDEAIVSAIELQNMIHPLIITSPDLNIKGYVGGGNGASAQVLGVARINGQVVQYGFSADCPDNWVQLNNEFPITLYKLQIIIKDETNKEADILDPNFNLWVKFRSSSSYCPPKGHELNVGTFLPRENRHLSMY